MSPGRPDTPLVCVVRRWPDLKGAIEVEFRRSAAFRGLCDDYRLCADAAARWQSSHEPKAVARRQEYAQWLGELENEIVEWLGAVPGDAPSRERGNP